VLKLGQQWEPALPPGLAAGEALEVAGHMPGQDACWLLQQTLSEHPVYICVLGCKAVANIQPSRLMLWEAMYNESGKKSRGWRR
jgi:hypothetical protein